MPSVLRLGRSLVLACASLGVTGAAHAGSLPFTASLTLEIVSLTPIPIGGGGTAVVNGSGGGTHLDSLALPASAIATSRLVVPMTDPGVAPIYGIQVTAANGPGNFAGGGGVMPLAGVAKICLFGSCPAATYNLSVPLSAVGQGDTAYVTGGGVNVTVVGAPWTTGTAAIGTLTQMGSLSVPAAGPAITLVTPVFISTNIGGSSVIPAFGTLSLHFIPEPATFALLGAGIAGLVGIGRGRRGDSSG